MLEENPEYNTTKGTFRMVQPLNKRNLYKKKLSDCFG